MPWSQAILSFDSGEELVSVKQAGPEVSTVTVVTPGKESKTVEFAEGSTVADLLEAYDPFASAVLIDGKEPTEFIPVKTGMVITVVPRPGNALESHAWRETVGMFPDDELLQEMVEAGTVIREADRAAVSKLDGQSQP
jgi:hypothetical protein